MRISDWSSDGALPIYRNLRRGRVVVEVPREAAGCGRTIQHRTIPLVPALARADGESQPLHQGIQFGRSFAEKRVIGVARFQVGCGPVRIAVDDAVGFDDAWVDGADRWIVDCGAVLAKIISAHKDTAQSYTSLKL